MGQKMQPNFKLGPHAIMQSRHACTKKKKKNVEWTSIVTAIYCQSNDAYKNIPHFQGPLEGAVRDF